MDSKSKVSVALVLIWAVLLAAVWLFPTILSVHVLLMILLPCQLVYIGYKLGIRFRSIYLKIATVLISGAFLVIATLVMRVALNVFHGWNIDFPTVGYLILGIAASLVGLLLSSLVKLVRFVKAKRS